VAHGGHRVGDLPLVGDVGDQPQVVVRCGFPRDGRHGPSPLAQQRGDGGADAAACTRDDDDRLVGEGAHAGCTTASSSSLDGASVSGSTAAGRSATFLTFTITAPSARIAPMATKKPQFRYHASDTVRGQTMLTNSKP